MVKISVNIQWNKISVANAPSIKSGNNAPCYYPKMYSQFKDKAYVNQTLSTNVAAALCHNTLEILVKKV